MNANRIKHLILINNIDCLFLNQLMKKKNWTEEEREKAETIIMNENSLFHLKRSKKIWGKWREF
jgi:hypothetical protein